MFLGQTDRMMTEAEALETLAREDPAVASDARAALRWLTAGGGLETISQLRLEEFLWHVLPSSWPLSANGQLAVARALGRLLALAGLDRYADTCASTETRQIINAYDSSSAEGAAAYYATVEASPATPPDTDLLAWGSVRGPEEQSAYEACAAAVEVAIAAQDIRVGASGWKTKRAALVDRWLTMSQPGDDTLLSRISAERIEEWTHGHPGERTRMAKRIVPRLLEPPQLPGEPLPSLRWLLQHADAGLPLTSRHYIAPSVVEEAADLFGWGEPDSRRRQELSVFPLHTLRGLAQREMGALRRSGASLVLTRTGRLMTDDAGVRWHIGTAALLGPDDGPEPDFAVAVREATLLIITLNGSAVSYEELIERLIRLHGTEGWTSRSGGNLVTAIRYEVATIGHRLTALRLLDPDGAPGELTLTGTGVAAALSALLARALRPRRLSGQAG
jgi:hypothetical protein